jgi:hypothetical protein
MAVASGFATTEAETAAAPLGADARADPPDAEAPDAAGPPASGVSLGVGWAAGAALGETTTAAARCGAGVAVGVGDGRGVGAGVGVAAKLSTSPPTTTMSDRWMQPA